VLIYLEVWIVRRLVHTLRYYLLFLRTTVSVTVVFGRRIASRFGTILPVRASRTIVCGFGFEVGKVVLLFFAYETMRLDAYA